jgi:hypothetical protein
MTPIQEYFEQVFTEHLEAISNYKDELRNFINRFDTNDIDTVVEDWATDIFEMSIQDSPHSAFNGFFKAAVWKTLDLDEFKIFIVNHLTEYKNDSEPETQSEAE